MQGCPGDLGIGLVFEIEADNPRFVGYARAYVVIKAGGTILTKDFLIFGTGVNG